jgi:hypothetical protein
MAEEAAHLVVSEKQKERESRKGWGPNMPFEGRPLLSTKPPLLKLPPLPNSARGWEPRLLACRPLGDIQDTNSSKW